MAGHPPLENIISKLRLPNYSTTITKTFDLHKNTFARSRTYLFETFPKPHPPKTEITHLAFLIVD